MNKLLRGDNSVNIQGQSLLYSSRYGPQRYE